MSTLSDQIQRYYNAYFGRPADPTGLDFWVNGVSKSGDLVGSAVSMFGNPNTPEFTALYPRGTSAETFVSQVYTNMFNRSPEAAGLKFWADGFRDKVANGTAEGVARAWIVTEIEKAAWAQSGTNDKLSLANKQVVGDAMTDSVSLYGTEASYLNDLADARALLAAVNHTQSSVNFALSRIKYGFVDGVDPTTGQPAPQVEPVVIENPKNLENAYGEVDLPAGEKNLITFKSASDSPFTTSYHNKFFAFDTDGAFVTAFKVGIDKLDFRAFDIVPTDGIVSIKAISWLTDSLTMNSTPREMYGVIHVDFFETPIVVSAWATPNNASGSSIFVDVNQDGNLSSADLVVHLVGVPTDDPAQLFLV